MLSRDTEKHDRSHHNNKKKTKKKILQNKYQNKIIYIKPSGRSPEI